METYWFSDLPDIKYFFVQISYFEWLIKWNLKKLICNTSSEVGPYSGEHDADQ